MSSFIRSNYTEWRKFGIFCFKWATSAFMGSMPCTNTSIVAWIDLMLQNTSYNLFGLDSFKSFLFGCRKCFYFLLDYIFLQLLYHCDELFVFLRIQQFNLGVWLYCRIYYWLWIGRFVGLKSILVDKCLCWCLIMQKATLDRISWSNS